MGFNRIEAKVRAKTSIRQARSGAMRVTLVFLLLTTVLSMVVGYLTFDPMNVVWELVAVLRYQVDEAVEYVWRNYSNQIWLYLAINVVLGIYTTVMSFGYTSYSLRLSRNEDPELSHIFDGFLKLLRVLWMNLLKGIFITLWTLLGLIPAMGLLAAGTLLEMDLNSLMGAYCFLLILGIVSAAIASYRYCLSDYFLLDDPSRTARQCITLSKSTMKGWKMERFTLDISFLGWMLCGRILVSSLSLIWYPAGVAGMLVFNAWYLPYVGVTVANFYNSVSGRTDPFQQGSDWENRMKDFNEAFDKSEF